MSHLATEPVRGQPGLHKKGFQVSQRNFFVHLFIFTFALSVRQTNKQKKNLQLKTQRLLTNAFKRLMKTWHGSMLAKLMLEQEAPSSPQIRFQLE